MSAAFAAHALTPTLSRFAVEGAIEARRCNRVPSPAPAGEGQGEGASTREVVR